MRTKISKTLESIIARTAFDTAKAAIDHSLKDYLLAAILRDEGSLARKAVESMIGKHDTAQLLRRIDRLTAEHSTPAMRPDEFFAIYIGGLTERCRDIRQITTLHALHDIISDPETVSSRAFAEAGITPDMLAGEIARLADAPLRTELFINIGLDDDAAPAAAPVPGADGDDSQTDPLTGRMPVRRAGETPLLAKFGVDLTQMARDGRLDPVIGREREIARVVQILSRRKKNNPVLIGEAGVGKSAVVEGLAMRIAAGDVPCTIASKRIFSLDLSSLVAGTKFRGDFEERMQQLLDELRRAKNTIVFIDEIHTIVGAGSSQGSLDTANILKPALARGEIQTIGATTLDEYRENIERDAALERRFQRVMIEPATRSETLEILRRIAPDYERHHNVRYTDEALHACVELAERYITDRHFPDKAVDVLDEAGSCARMATSHEPQMLRDMEKRLAETRRERREAVESLAYDRAAAARIREIALASSLDERRAEWLRALESAPAVVGAEQIAAVITSMTGIPAERVAGGELERLRTLHDRLSERVVGQSEAVERVARAIRRSRSGLKDENRPVGVFMFVGPTGVGKTLLAKELSKLLFDEHRGLIRIDMSEYGEKHNVSRLIGSPPGYVGYGEGGQLTEAVRRRPYSVVLFDEIEKAHPDIFNAMLQIFDEGHLTDGSGRRVDFRNTVIIMTSNAGSRGAAVRVPHVGFATVSKCTDDAGAPAEDYMKALEQTFAPEFLNRIDDVVVFRTLEAEDVGRIIDLELRDMLSRAERLGYRVRITEEAKRRLAEMGYESRYGARALRRTLQDEVEEPLSNMIIDGKLREGDTVVVDKSELSGITLSVA